MICRSKIRSSWQTSRSRNFPLYGSREVLFVVSGLSTCDPGNVHTAIAAAKSAKVRVSVVSVAAEMHVCRRMSEETGGMFGVSTSQHHLEELLLGHAPPPPLNEEATKASLVHMGFPKKRALEQGAFFSGRGGEYVCPRCSSRVEELPSQCTVCSLTLVSSPHLARSYHHLFPVAPFKDVEEGGRIAGNCFACRRKIDIRASQGMTTMIRPHPCAESASKCSVFLATRKYTNAFIIALFARMQY